MPDRSPTGAIDAIQRQVRRVRRQRNVHELQRALYLLVAAAAGAVSLLLLLALRVDDVLFAVATWSIAAGFAATAALLVREAWRRWLGPIDAIEWIERRGDLRGRLRTLCELGERAGHAPTAFFAPLLVEQNVRRLGLWTPSRLVPRRVPRGALAAALAAINVLVLVLRFAGALQPQVPEVVFTDQPLAASDAPGDADGAPPSRVVVGPAAARERSGSRHSAAGVPAPGSGAGDESALARLPGELQERIRRELWGKAWDAARAARARGERTAQRAPGAGVGEGRSAPPDHGDDAEDETWELAEAPAGAAARRLPATRAHAAQEGSAERLEHDPADDPEDAQRAAGSGASAASRAAGAGTDTDPSLYGGAATTLPLDHPSFELAIATRVRARRGSGRERGGEAPPPAADEHPTLGDPRRREAPGHRMTVPPAYEAIVREVFAHRPVENAP